MTGLCLERHDHCVSKIAALRDKDRQFIRALVEADMVDRQLLKARVATTALPPEKSDQVQAFLSAL